MYDLSEVSEYIELYKEGYSIKNIYKKYYSVRHPDKPIEAFRSSMRNWMKKYISADDKTLLRGTYPSFVAHGATVQINKSGEITQAWIKQHTSDFNMDELLETIKENVEPVRVNVSEIPSSIKMLEIPLYDMHFPLSDHKGTLSELLPIINRDNWDEINLIIGQDLFHNDDFKGRTTSGRSIEKLDMVVAWNQAKDFWYNVICNSLEHSKSVKIIYSKGNHDETLAWAFVQLLKAMFPQVEYDDNLKRRKCIYWKGCFIGVSHGCESKSNTHDLRGQFTIDFSREFADSSVREIHVGHLHHEREADIYGVMVRRLCTATPKDTWSDDEGYVGNHRRFMVFEWKPHRLSVIHYIQDGDY